MALPIVARFDGETVQTVVRNNAEWSEYIVQFWYLDKVQGRFAYHSAADYHTSDKQDALDTAKAAASVPVCQG